MFELEDCHQIDKAWPIDFGDFLIIIYKINKK
jgi:hypothetical protein